MVFGVLIVHCGLLGQLVLLIAGTMPSVYSRLQGNLHLYFDTMTPLIMIELLWACDAISACTRLSWPRIPVEFHAHAG